MDNQIDEKYFDPQIYSAECLEYGKLCCEKACSWWQSMERYRWNGEDMLQFHQMPERLQHALTSAVKMHTFALIERMKGEQNFSVDDCHAIVLVLQSCAEFSLLVLCRKKDVLRKRIFSKSGFLKGG